GTSRRTGGPRVWPTTPPTADRSQHRLAPLVTAVIGIGAVVAAAALAWLTGLVGEPPARPSWPALAGYLALLTASDLLSVRARLRSTTQGVTWPAEVILVGLATLPVPWVALAAVVGVLIAQRRPRVRV